MVKQNRKIEGTSKKTETPGGNPLLKYGILLVLALIVCVVIGIFWDPTDAPAPQPEPEEPVTELPHNWLEPRNFDRPDDKGGFDCNAALLAFAKGLRLLDTPMYQRNAAYRDDLLRALRRLHLVLCANCRELFEQWYPGGCADGAHDAQDYSGQTWRRAN